MVWVKCGGLVFIPFDGVESWEKGVEVLSLTVARRLFGLRVSHIAQMGNTLSCLLSLSLAAGGFWTIRSWHVCEIKNI
jgi:hypothetical protein